MDSETVLRARNLLQLNATLQPPRKDKATVVKYNLITLEYFSTIVEDTEKLSGFEVTNDALNLAYATHVVYKAAIAAMFFLKEDPDVLRQIEKLLDTVMRTYGLNTG